VLQGFKVTPAQSSLERPYIERNITATRAAYNLNSVNQAPISGQLSLSSTSLAGTLPTLDNIRLWDPDPSISLQTFQKQQNQRSYYTFQSVGVDRYTVGGKVTPAVIGTRQLDPSGIPNATWVNTHLEYTHGEGVALAPANEVSASGSPNFAIKNVPPESRSGYPRVTQPDVYFGLNDPGYVVTNTRQAELDYPTSNGTGNVSNHYSSTGGVRVGNFFTRAAFALRLGDFNLLVSSQVTDQSRIMFVRDIVTMAQKAAPFLSYDHDPYAAVVNGHIDWVLDAYTTSAGYPYSQNINSQVLPPQSGLPSSYNYVRNSVKVVVDAYTGKITFYDVDPRDPVLQAYEKAFPGLFTPITKAPSQLTHHLRYPEDIFAAQAAIYGRYHLTNAQAFYNGGNSWSVSPTSGVGQRLSLSTSLNAQGQEVTGPPLPMAPLYQVLKEPGLPGQRLTELSAYVPAIQQNPTAQNLTGYLIADSDPQHYGTLTVYKTPTNTTVQGPAQAEARIAQNKTVSKDISLLDTGGTYVILGNILVVPIGESVIYVRPLYVANQSNPQPQLTSIITEYNGAVGYEPTLQAALRDVLGPNLPALSAATGGANGNGTQPPSGTSSTAQSLIAQALTDYSNAQQALKNGDFATYGADLQAMHNALQQASQALSKAGTSATPGTSSSARASTTTTTAPAHTTGTSSTGSTTTHGTLSNSPSPARSGGGAPRDKGTTTTKPGEA
jgi:uncharacterized membrane protein (UPF0182 family)